MGLQRYANGGNTVRCIDALGAMTGNIGRSGGGVNYANRSITRWIDREGGALTDAPPPCGRTFPLPRMAHFIRSAKTPPIAVMMIAKANPLVQMPDTRAMQTALAQVPFKIVIDMFMTDTAHAADLVLPCTSILEEEDLVFSSMFSPYLNYARRRYRLPKACSANMNFSVIWHGACASATIPTSRPALFWKMPSDP